MATAYELTLRVAEYGANLIETQAEIDKIEARRAELVLLADTDDASRRELERLPATRDGLEERLSNQQLRVELTEKLLKTEIEREKQEAELRRRDRAREIAERLVEKAAEMDRLMRELARVHGETAAVLNELGAVHQLDSVQEMLLHRSVIVAAGSAAGLGAFDPSYGGSEVSGTAIALGEIVRQRFGSLLRWRRAAVKEAA